MMFLIQIRYIQYCDQLYLYRPTQGNPGNFCLLNLESWALEPGI